ncbi:PDDEXK nuclease domain-containing protein [Alistipes senegalensis]|uniref:PDDEXK nuclease domain-containing protein n=1 Tax=Alistipes senegalensis TaxID=1288121 RepID=UPI0018AA215E|nr:PDDEXK nuclease domain-containing protein [Alistipes senegalensis]
MEILLSAFAAVAPRQFGQSSIAAAFRVRDRTEFLMEMDDGYAFVARRQHISADAGDYFIGLVFCC